MIKLSGTFEERMRALLAPDELSAFTEALQETTPVSIRYNLSKTASRPETAPVAWCEAGGYLAERPVFTLDPLLHAGTYYVQEASSMFVEQAVRRIDLKRPVKALDLCAAPGGKSTHLAGLLPAGSLLVSNEVIRQRVNILAENLSKWGSPNVVVSHNDPEAFHQLPGFFDLLLIDAPCSGEGMFRKDPQAVEEWSPANVQLCAERQRRIVSDAWDALCEDGWLIYSTCTYNREENEENVQWMIRELGAELIRIPLDPAWNITESDYGYRFYPHKTKGEGFFLSLLRKTAGTAPGSSHKIKPPRLQAVKNAPQWLSGDFTTLQHDVFLQAWPTTWLHEIAQLKQTLRIIQAGVQVGEIKGRDIVPDTAVALSNALHPEAFPMENVALETALRFLRRDSISLQSTAHGFHLVSYENHPLGFVKNIGTRSNNLYPQAWRIRMQLPEL